MRHNDFGPEERAAELLRRDEEIALDMMNQIAADNSIDGTQFTREQVLTLLARRLDLERKVGTDYQLAHRNLMMDFRAELSSRGLPDQEIIQFFEDLETDTVDGMLQSVDRILCLIEVISVYADRLAAEKAARAAMSAPKEPDILRAIFGLEDK